MTKAKLTAADLAHFTGTEVWHQHTLNHRVTYTDGVNYFAEKAGAYWLLDIIATELPRFLKTDRLLVVKANVKQGKAELTADGSNPKTGKDVQVWKRKIAFTDCPEGEWRFYFATGGPNNTLTILLPSEY